MPAWKAGAFAARPRARSGRRGSRTLKAHRSTVFETAAIAHWLALPYSQKAAVAGIEPAKGRLTGACLYQHRPHRKMSRHSWIRTNGLLLPKQADCQAIPYADYKSAQRESNPHFRHGKAAGCRYIMGARRTQPDCQTSSGTRGIRTLSGTRPTHQLRRIPQGS